ncbi:hypothetical protein THAOC_31036 [Thalassiosira oceanica]|uniref:Cyclin C-terminal domain-containing protein n=1 Tax=Thalassiosira oceanica TaxID=159749 RepID=K0RM86_THAOC|nr:hypothetical protein THAOC_31036 [Thalassiosira oceanica]|eukprot:EJK50036.1 hypothetical protein THAOC_31036 [Thalassiosira oceanica]
MPRSLHPEEIASEEMCILQVLAWYVHPPTASQAANHILPIVKDSTSAAGHDWEPFVDRVHRLIDVSVFDLDLSMLRPSTVAMAAILVSRRHPTRHPDHLIDGCLVYGKTSYAWGGRHGAKRTMVICRSTAKNGRFWFIKEKGSGHHYCAREKEVDVPPRVGWRVSSSLSGTSPPPKLDW